MPTPPIKRATLKIAVQVHVKIFVRKFQALYFSLHFDVSGSFQVSFIWEKLCLKLQGGNKVL